MSESVFYDIKSKFTLDKFDHVSDNGGFDGIVAVDNGKDLLVNSSYLWKFNDFRVWANGFKFL